MSKVDKSGAWNQVKYLRKLLDSTNDEALNRLEDSWSLLVESRLTLARDEESANLHFSPATYLTTLVSNGCYPPPELLLWLVGNIEEYVEAKGKKDLEVLLFGERTKGKHGGVYAARERVEKNRLDLLMELGRIRVENKGITLRGAVCLALADDFYANPNGTTDIESALRTLRSHGYTNKRYRSKDQDDWYALLRAEFPNAGK